MLWNKDLTLFAPQAISEKHHRSLLIQFMLFELFEAYKSLKENRWENILTPHPRFFPYDWAKMSGHLNKLQEHSLLLANSFPEQHIAMQALEEVLEGAVISLSAKMTPKRLTHALSSLYKAIEPFTRHCKENENLLSFLLKHRTSIDALTEKGHLHRFLLELHPEGLETLGEKMCDQYHQRGFFSQIPEFKLLLTELIHV